MKKRSPTLQGFQAMFRWPSLGLAEIAWRWSFGFAVAALFTFAALEYLDTLPVTSQELFLLRTRQPVLISQAIAHIFQGSAPRAVAATIVIALGSALAWIAVASLGRAATIRALQEYVRGIGSEREVDAGRLAGKVEMGKRSRLRSLVGLNLFRLSATLAAAISCLGALLVAGAASPASDPSPGSAVLIFFTLSMFIGLAWYVLNWFLSLAAIFVVGERQDTFGALAATLDLCRRHSGSVAAAGTWFGVAHVAALVVASSVAAFPLAFAGLLPGGVVLGGFLLVALLYFAVADFLYVGRLAAFVAIMESPLPPPTFPSAGKRPPDPRPLTAVHLPGSSRVDPDELILSDVPE